MRAAIVPDNHFKTGGHLRRLLFCLTILTLLFITLILIFSPQALADTPVNGSISGSVIWNTSESPYILNGMIEITPNSTLNIPAGVVVKGADSGSGLYVRGALTATGATFTSASSSPQAGDWKWIYFDTGSSGSLKGCTVSYGGSGLDYWNANIYIQGSSPTITDGTIISNSRSNGVYVASGSPSITKSVISNNGSGGSNYYGVYAATQFTAFNSNSITDNTGVAVSLPANMGQNTIYDNTYSGSSQKNAMFVTGVIDLDTDWPLSNSPYVITAGAGTTVNLHKTLTIDRDVVVKPQGTDPFIVEGTLNATGAIFTSYKDDTHGGDTNGDGGATSPAPGDWKWVFFDTGSHGAITDCQLTYGGWGGTGKANIYIQDSALTIRNTAISYSAQNGIFVFSGSPDIQYNDIFDLVRLFWTLS